MPRPTRLRLLQELPATPPHEEDETAPAPVVLASPIAPSEAEAVIAQLRLEADLAIRQRNEMAAAQRQAATDAQQAQATVEALKTEALSRIGAVERERDEARQALTEKTDDRKRMAAMATAVSLGLLQQFTAELVKLAAWVPALAALAGGIWLFWSCAAPSPTTATLIALALYGPVIMMPAALLTWRRRE